MPCVYICQMSIQVIDNATACYHCGDDCGKHPILAHDKHFCCQGCKMVYEILAQNDLCDYYALTKNPGIAQKHIVREGKFAFLDDEGIAGSLIDFKDQQQTHICFYLPQVHCSSCLWLLENLHRLNSNISSSKVQFVKKEVTIIFDHRRVSLRKVAGLLTSIGYEPYLSLGDMRAQKPKTNKAKIYKLGVAGFCFANIMLMSFPEYFGIDEKELSLQVFFRMMNVLLCLPVVFYSASEFYTSAWKAVKHRFLNIDAPIVLAIAVTFSRSLYEVCTNTGSGYFDSLSGIVFFMLIGRVLQDKTHEQLSFDRDYTAYFPVAVTRLEDKEESVVSLPDIKLNDSLLIHHGELIPADGILTRGQALIDYSFVTGESTPVIKAMGELVYAGGRQTGGSIEILVVKEVAQSYLTRLWNRDRKPQGSDDDKISFVHVLSRWFTCTLFMIAAATAIYWYIYDISKLWSSVTAVLIVACPCALLLSNTFTNGNVLRILARNGLYLRNAASIETLAEIDHIVFDKTGTLTRGAQPGISYDGVTLTTQTKELVASMASQSSHPASRAIARFLAVKQYKKVTSFKETPGKGIEGYIDGRLVTIGSRSFVLDDVVREQGSRVYVAVDGILMGYFSLHNHYREHIPALLKALKKEYSLTILSGDNAGEQLYLQQLLEPEVNLLFNQQPQDKLIAIEQLQQQGKHVLMVGDGLNDAGALEQADAGIAVAEDTNHFTPASDGILDAAKLSWLKKMIRLCQANKQIVWASFAISILYNVIGLSIAVQGNLSPVIAAILMPASSLTILLITYGASSIAARLLRFK